MSKYLYYLDKMNNYEKRLDTILASRQSLYYENKYYGQNHSIIENNISEYQYDNYLRYLNSINSFSKLLYSWFI